MKRSAVTVFLMLLSVCAAFGQGPKTIKAPETPKSEATAADRSAIERAQATQMAHGGDKLKNLRSLVMRGSVDITTSAMNQAIPSTFVTVIAGDKYNYEINNPFQPLKQVYDGTQTFSSLRGFSLPPITSLGFPLLTKIGVAGYVITSLSDAKKKRSGFRITTPEGYYTDFLTDEKTSQVKGYESSYDYDGRTITTSVVVDKCLLVDGVLVPERYSQRFDLGQLTAYADFKSKVILVNSTIDNDVFAMPK
ncbi:MAG: hypothetical protein ABJA02_07285 [Acidobacteriota bacterium]